MTYTVVPSHTVHETVCDAAEPLCHRENDPRTNFKQFIQVLKMRALLFSPTRSRRTWASASFPSAVHSGSFHSNPDPRHRHAQLSFPTSHFFFNVHCCVFCGGGNCCVQSPASLPHHFEDNVLGTSVGYVLPQMHYEYSSAVLNWA